MNRTEKTKIKVGLLLFWFVLITSFVFFAGLIHLKANGWQINFRTLELTQTGMIILSGVPEKAEVRINNQVKNNYLPVKLSNLSPGYYDVDIVATDYRAWHKTIQVLSGKASLNQNIILFLAHPQEVAVSAEITPESILEEYQKKTAELKFFDSEIFWQDKFITRFSQNILAAIIYPDNNHIVFQQGNEMRVIDIDGSNDILLFHLSSAEPTLMTIKNNDRTIYYLDQGKIQAKNIN